MAFLSSRMVLERFDQIHSVRMEWLARTASEPAAIYARAGMGAISVVAVGRKMEANIGIH